MPGPVLARHREALFPALAAFQHARTGYTLQSSGFGHLFARLAEADPVATLPARAYPGLAPYAYRFLLREDPALASEGCAATLSLDAPLVTPPCQSPKPPPTAALSLVWGSQDPALFDSDWDLAFDGADLLVKDNEGCGPAIFDLGRVSLDNAKWLLPPSVPVLEASIARAPAVAGHTYLVFSSSLYTRVKAAVRIEDAGPGLRLSWRVLATGPCGAM
jgi:hypothetical protein